MTDMKELIERAQNEPETLTDEEVQLVTQAFGEVAKAAATAYQTFTDAWVKFAESYSAVIAKYADDTPHE